MAQKRNYWKKKKPGQKLYMSPFVEGETKLCLVKFHVLQSWVFSKNTWSWEKCN